MSNGASRTLMGTRRCIRCGYSLGGQSIVRDAALDLHIVRCPECGTATSAQELPLLGGWRRFWAAFAAVTWSVVVLGVWLGCAGMLYGLCRATLAAGCVSYQEHLTELYTAAVSESDLPPIPAPLAMRPGWVRVVGQTQTLDFASWWDQQDPAELLRSRGGWAGAVSLAACWVGLPLGLAAFVWGCFWSMVFADRRAPGRLLIGALLLATIGAFCMPLLLDWRSGEVYWSNGAAELQLGTPLLGLSLAVVALALALGLTLGRAAGRALLRVAVPATLLGNLTVPR
jgi:hypothetical protein